jgi:hypothetical protein
MSSKKKKAANAPKKAANAKAKAPAKAKARAKAPAKAKAKAPAKAKAKAPAKAPAKAKAKAPAKAKARTGKTGSVGAASTSVVKRRDGTGHLNPKYAADLLAKSRESVDDDGSNRAFLKGKSRTKDPLGEELGEDAVRTMTSGEDQSDQLQLEVEEEIGGPFVTTSGGQEFARGTDRSNPRKATREPFPKT